MGKLLSKVMKKLSADSPKRILMLGLDNAGKTTIIYRMKDTEDFHTVPTVGFNVETITPARGVSLTVWDVGGQDNLRALWHHYFEHVDGLVFVIDCADHRRISIAKAELNGIFQHESMKTVPLVIIANKQDSKDALKKESLAEKLDMSHWPHGLYHIEECCALTGVGLTEAFASLAKLIHKQKENNRLGVR